MGKMNIVISDKTEARFRDAVARDRGMKKGNISKVLEEVINDWLESRRSAVGPKRQY
jgi:hypothetical protein